METPLFWLKRVAAHLGAGQGGAAGCRNWNTRPLGGSQRLRGPQHHILSLTRGGCGVCWVGGWSLPRRLTFPKFSWRHSLAWGRRLGSLPEGSLPDLARRTVHLLVDWTADACRAPLRSPVRSSSDRICLMQFKGDQYGARRVSHLLLNARHPEELVYPQTATGLDDPEPSSARHPDGG